MGKAEKLSNLFKTLVLGWPACIWDETNIDCLPTMHLGHNKQKNIVRRDQKQLRKEKIPYIANLLRWKFCSCKIEL